MARIGSRWGGALFLILTASWPISSADRPLSSTGSKALMGGHGGSGGGGGGAGGVDHGHRGGKGPSWLQSQRLFRAERVSLFLRAPSASERVTKVLGALHELKKPNSRMISRRDAVLRETKKAVSFNAETIEQVCGRNGASLFGIGTHTKRRPHNLMLGRTFGGKILDSFDLSVVPAVVEPHETDHPMGRAALGTTPCFVFLGQEWQRNTRLSELKNLLIDGLGVRHSDELHLRAVERAIVCSALNSTRVHLTQYMIDPEAAQKGQAVLSQAEPSVTFDVRETSVLADNDMMRKALNLKDPMKTDAEKKDEKKKAFKTPTKAKRDKVLESKLGFKPEHRKR